MTVTFDGVELVNAGPLKPREDARSFEITIECQTEDYTYITAMIARAGKATVSNLLSGQTAVQTKAKYGKLILHDDTYEKCVIVGGVEIEEVGGTGGTQWKYRLKFVQDRREPLITPTYPGDVMFWPLSAAFQDPEIDIEQVDPALAQTPPLCTATPLLAADKMGDALSVSATVSESDDEMLAGTMTNLATEITVT